jgi:hypothetical protein
MGERPEWRDGLRIAERASARGKTPLFDTLLLNPRRRAAEEDRE